MESRFRAMGSLGAVVMACAGVGAAAPAYAQPKPPWSGRCVVESAELEAEIPFIVQGCQRAFSAAARAARAAEVAGPAAAATAATAAEAAEAAADASEAADAATAADAAATAADAAAATFDDNRIDIDADSAAGAAASAAAVAKLAARVKAKPTDAATAYLAAQGEERAVKASKKAFGGPDPVKIIQIP
ncbi:hypothetical protein [Nocardia brasiliensis]|uniref:hypothetical protein n=1 Tax=Nocardia brasiliensis TaxID=37326 RepID=UPI0036716C01